MAADEVSKDSRGEFVTSFSYTGLFVHGYSFVNNDFTTCLVAYYGVCFVHIARTRGCRCYNTFKLSLSPCSKCMPNPWVDEQLHLIQTASPYLPSSVKNMLSVSIKFYVNIQFCRNVQEALNFTQGNIR